MGIQESGEERNFPKTTREKEIRKWKALPDGACSFEIFLLVPFYPFFLYFSLAFSIFYLSCFFSVTLKGRGADGAVR